MELTIKTSFKNVEVANYILNIALSHLEDSERARKILGVTPSDIKSAERFLKGIYKSSCW